MLPAATFATIVVGDEVAVGKPDPEPYLAAARALGVDTADCVAIEDSPTGLRSAEASGCAVIAVPNLVPIEPAPSRSVMTSLVGVTPESLGALLAARHG